MTKKVSFKFDNIDIIENENRLRFQIDFNKESDELSNNLAGIENVLNNIAEIMAEKDSLNIKQENLEALNQPFAKKAKELRFTSPHDIQDIILELDNRISKQSALEHHIPHQEFVSGEKKTKPRVSASAQEFLGKLHSLTTHFRTIKESIALLIIFCLSDSIREMTPETSVIYYGHAINKINAYNINVKNDSIGKIENVSSEIISHDTIEKKFPRIKQLKKTQILNKIADRIIQVYHSSLEFQKKKTLTNTFTLDDKFRLAAHVGYYLEAMQVLLEIELNDKTKIYGINPDIYQKINQLSYYTISLPMVTSPEQWRIEPVSKKLTFGGYKMNTIGIFPGVHLKTEGSNIQLSEDVVDMINYLQQHAFKIDKKNLDYMRNNLYESLLQYLNETSRKKKLNWNECFDILETTTEQIFIFKSEKTFLFDQNLSKETVNYRARIFTTTINILAKFFYTIGLASLFEKTDLYFKCFMDNRMRVYYHAFGLNPQGDVLSKALLRLNINNTTTGNLKTSAENIIKLSNSKSSKQFWEELEQSTEIVKADVSCSALQILGAVCAEEAALIDTNFMKVKGNANNSEKQDAYVKILTTLKKRLEETEQHPDPIKTQNVLNLIKEFTSNQLDRSFIKGWTMRYLYSEGHYTRVTFLMQENWSVHLGAKKLTWSELHAAATFVSKQFVLTMFELYPRTCGFSVMLQKNVSNIMNKQGTKTTLTLAANKKSSVCDISYVRQKPKKFEYYSFKRKKRVAMVLQINTNKLDASKLKNSIVPNFVHHLDAEALKYTVLKCKDLEIPIATVHDCFIIPLDFLEKVKELYFEGVRTRVLHKAKEDNPLYWLLKKNINLEEDNQCKKEIEELFDLLKEVGQKSEEIANCLDQEIYEKSEFILT